MQVLFAPVVGFAQRCPWLAPGALLFKTSEMYVLFVTFEMAGPPPQVVLFG